MNATTISVSHWWLQKRLHYNKGLLFTGLMGFVTQATVQQSFANKLISGVLFDMRISGVCFIVFLILANVAFTLGSILDLLFNHQNSQSFRDWLFFGGCWFAIAVLILFIIAFLFFS